MQYYFHLHKNQTHKHRTSLIETFCHSSSVGILAIKIPYLKIIRQSTHPHLIFAVVNLVCSRPNPSPKTSLNVRVLGPIETH